MLAFADRSIKATAELHGLAEQTGIAASAIASFKTASDTSGLSLDSIAKLVEKLNVTLSRPIDETKGPGAALKAIGLSADDLRTKTPDVQIELIAQKLAGFAEGAGRGAVAVTLLGKSGAAALPFLNDLAESGRSQIKLSDEQIDAAEKYSKAQARSRSELSQLAQVAALQALPAMTSFTDVLKESAAALFGVDSGSKILGSNTAVASFAENAVVALGHVVDAGDGVIRTFGAVGRFVGAYAAVSGALLKGEVQQAKQIGAEFRADTDQLLSAPLFSDRLAARLAASKIPLPAAAAKPELNFRIVADGPKANGAAAREAEQVRKAARDAALKSLDASLTAERDAYAFHGKFLSGVFAASQVSLEEYFAERKAATVLDEREESESFARRIAELKRYRDATRDPSERVKAQTAVEDTEAKAAQASIERQRRATLAVQEETAARKVLSDRVTDFRAQLLQAEGDDAGAAALRARQAIDAARLFAKSTQGSASPVTDDDLARQERAIKVRDALALVQSRVSTATADATRSEEIFLLLATRGGADLATQDQGLLKIRSKLVDQLGEAARKTQDLAEAAIAAAKVSGGVVDPKVLTEAANAARDYIVALNNVDPAYKRLQDAGNALGTSIADTLGGAIAKFTSLKDAARSVGHQIFESLTKQFVTAPLEKQIQGILGKIIDGDNPVSAALRSAAGAQDTGVRAAQTAAITASTNALVAFSNAANSAALSFGPSAAKFTGSSTDPSAANYENSSDQSSSAAEAAKSLGAFGKTTSTTADLFTGAVSTLVSSTGRAGAAIAGLPGVISNVSSYVYSLLSSASSSSSASGAASLIGKFFGGGGGSSVGSSASYAANDFIAAANGHAFSTSGVQAFAKGDIFNTPTAFRFAKGSGFANGVMGEAGPEAVMPLRRGADGKLGVASAGGSTNVTHLNVTVQAAPNMSRDTALQQGATIGAGIQRALARNG